MVLFFKTLDLKSSPVKALDDYKDLCKSYLESDVELDASEKRLFLKRYKEAIKKANVEYISQLYSSKFIDLF
jgi:hypothetical protein